MTHSTNCRSGIDLEILITAQQFSLIHTTNTFFVATYCCNQHDRPTNSNLLSSDSHMA